MGSKFTGRIENWYFDYTTTGSVVVCGDIYEDKKGRFYDGMPIHTSKLVSPTLSELSEGVIITTRNSTYLLGKPAKH